MMSYELTIINFSFYISQFLIPNSTFLIKK